MDIHNNIKPATLEEAFDVQLMQLKPVSLHSILSKKSIEDVFLANSTNGEIVHPSKMKNHSIEDLDLYKEQPETIDLVKAIDKVAIKEKDGPIPFILANTIDVPIDHLRDDCIIPVFSKDNEKTIAHQEFIDVVINAVHRAFPNEEITQPEIKVSHQIKGRTPDAIHLNVKDLLEHQKTIYYERMAFIIKIPTIKDSINGNELFLTLGGVRSYNLENLYNKKTFEKFKFFIGFQNKVCCNLCISTDGFLAELKVSTIGELHSKILQTIYSYNAELHLMEMKELTQDFLSEHQFAQLIGKSRLYQHLPKTEKKNIPLLNFNDSHINIMAREYYEDNNFSRLVDGNINLWNVFNLFTQANKSSYIDTFLDRNLNAFEFTKGLQKTLNGNSDYHWFLS